MAFAESVTAGDQRHGLFIIHRHAGKGLADIAAGSDRVGIAVRAFRIDVDQAHLHGCERVFQVAIAAIALIAKPGALGTPIDILFRFPDIGAATGEAESRTAHRFQGAIAGQNHQIGPGDFLAVFLLDRPEQAACLVEIDIVGPAIERRKTLRAGAGTAAAIADAIGAGAVPGHADEEGAVMAIISRPPVLAVRHQGVEVLLDRLQVEALERLGVIEIRIEWIGQTGILAEDLKIQLFRPPVAIIGRSGCRVSLGCAHYRAFAFAVHVISDHGSW